MKVCWITIIKYIECYYVIGLDGNSIGGSENMFSICFDYDTYVLHLSFI